MRRWPVWNALKGMAGGRSCTEYIFLVGGILYTSVYTVHSVLVLCFKMWVGFNFSMDFLQVILGRIWFGFYVVFARPEINCDVKNLNFLG